jgi:hypothetical protein
VSSAFSSVRSGVDPGGTSVLALDVALHVTAQVTFDLQVLIDVGTDPVDLVLGQVRDLGVRIELELSADLLRGRQADSEDVGE